MLCTRTVSQRSMRQRSPQRSAAVTLALLQIQSDVRSLERSRSPGTAVTCWAFLDSAAAGGNQSTRRPHDSTFLRERGYQCSRPVGHLVRRKSVDGATPKAREKSLLKRLRSGNPHVKATSVTFLVELQSSNNRFARCNRICFAN